jgi:hypothetical protein
MDDVDQTIRERAYQLWDEDGRPEGRSDEYWERARFLVGIAANPEAGTLPNPSVPTVQNPGGTARSVTAEPIAAAADLGEFPAGTDQGEKSTLPIIKEKQAQ